MLVMALGGRREGKADLRMSVEFVTWPFPCTSSHLFPSVFRVQLRPPILTLLLNICSK